MLDDVDQIILHRIPTVPQRASTPDIAEALRNQGHDLGPRALQKRLATLETEHAIVRYDGSKPHQWSWHRGAKQKLFPNMAPHEALSLLLAREHLRALLPPRTLQWIEERLEQSEREVGIDQTGKSGLWRTKVRRVPHDLPRVAPRIDARVFKSVSEALFEGLQLSLRYRKRFVHEPTEYVVHPIGLCEREAELWLAARKHQEDAPGELRFFLLHRMLDAKVLRGRPAVAPAGFTLDVAIREGMAHFPLELGNAVPLVARFDDCVIEKLDESPLAADQTLERLPDGWVRLRATVPHTRALHTFLVGYGPLCVVESPRALVDAIVTDLESAVAAYRR